MTKGELLRKDGSCGPVFSLRFPLAVANDAGFRPAHLTSDLGIRPVLRGALAAPAGPSGGA